MSVDPLAQERDAKFKVWLQNKALRDKAFEFLARLNSDRATEEDSLVEVAVSLCAIDRLLGNEDEKKKTPATGGENTFKDPGATAKKTLKSSWFRWTMEHYSFSMIHLSDKDVDSLSGAVKEFLFSESDIIASAGNYGEELERASKVKNILPSLKYFFPQVPKPNEKARPLTNDQKAQNVIYMREARKLWRKAGEELNNRVVEYVARAMKTSGKQGIPSHETERESKMKHDAAYQDHQYSGNSSSYETTEERTQKAKKLELQCLSELSLKQLKIWIEEDEDKKTSKANEDAMEKLKMAKQSHEQFVKKKDGLRIRMPESLAPVSQPTMGYGREMSGVRATAKGVSTTVDLMAGMGLKYVHATSKGRKGQMGDLEKSREQLLKMGFVDKSNFNSDEQDAYDRERRENHIIKEKKELEIKQKEENKRAYDEWIAQKELRDSALKCINLLPKPVHEQNSEDPYGRSSTTSLRRSQVKSSPDNTLALTNPMLNPGLSQHCIEVGRAMKKVDRTTFLDWARWCEGIFSPNTASILWDSFAPIACDVHCASYSQVRDTFIKLLRPGVDYRQTFMEYVEKNIFTRKINRFKEQKDYYHLREDAQQELDEEIESLRKEWLSEIALSKEDMNKLLLSMGILLKETEMRTLIDAFDSNNDGVVTIMEFLDFTGVKKDKRGGNNIAMSQRCCWLTTCKITGMSNAYSVSAPTKRFLSINNNMEESKSTEYDEMYQKNKHSNTITNTTNINNSDTIIRKLANGETRVCIELKERKKREDLLKKMGLIKNEKVGKMGMKKKSVVGRSEGKEDDEEQYEDDFAETNDNNEDYGDDFDQDEEQPNGNKLENKKTKANNPNICQYSTWRPEDRKEGLKVLLDMTKEARQEETLKTLLANGVPPAPPKLWIQNERNIETKSLNRRSINNRSRGEEKSGEYSEDEDMDQADVDSDSTEITLFWGPHKGDLVSFYSLEYGGQVGATKTSDVKYTEIYRDPPDADPNNTFDFAYTLRNLTPGASYRFRMRAFNGFGAGEYTYKTFSTITAAPAQPHVIKLTSDSVCLKWTFSSGFFRRLDELRRIFTLADSDKSGMVSREELTALLDERASSSPQLKSFLSKVAQGLGLVVSQGYDALFDMIEGDDDGGLSWAEFEGFFMAAGWGNQTSVMGATGTATGTANFSTGNMQSTLRPGQGPAGTGIAVAPGDINYVVERCESEIDDKYVEVLRTTLGYGTLTRLDPGKSYRFRVFSLNADGVAGPCSLPVLVHTLVETPNMPTAPSKFIQARKVTITWKPRTVFAGTRNKAFTDKMLEEWAGALGDDESGVSIRAAFDKYDRDQSGGIDPAELKAVLEDLGVDASEERLNEAFEILDKNNDGVISYEEFGKWWRRDSVSYTLKRSEEVIPMNTALYTAIDNGTNRFRSGSGNNNTSSSVSQMLGTATRERATSRNRSRGMGAIAEEGSQRSGSRSRPQSANNDPSPAAAASSPAMKTIQQVAVPIVVYRGERTRCDVMGLTPNRLYHFKMRYVGSRSNSILSPPLVLMTAPLPTSCPVLIDVTASTVRAKWYPGQYGAFKFIVHMRLASDATVNPANNFSATNMNTTTNSNMNNATRKVATGLIGADTGEEGWVAVYNGQDNVYTAASLASNTAYQLRVFAVNCQGVCSEPSDVINFTTNQRTDKDMTLTPKNAGAKFTIECTGDICVGDVILITERLFVKNRPTSATTSAATAAGVRTSLNSTTGGLPPRSRSSGRNNLRDSHNTTAPVAQAKSGALLMNMSVTSLNGAGLDTASITPSRGEYLGERTIAAYVARDNYRTIRDALTSAGIEPKNHKKFGTHRKLWLEVVWQRTADEACKPYDLKSGEVLERMQSHLEQFEVFRCSWKDEINRKPLQEEWKTMMECFIQTNCT